MAIPRRYGKEAQRPAAARREPERQRQAASKSAPKARSQGARRAEPKPEPKAARRAEPKPERKPVRRAEPKPEPTPARYDEDDWDSDDSGDVTYSSGVRRWTQRDMMIVAMLIVGSFFVSFAYAATTKSNSATAGTAGTASAAPLNLDPQAKLQGGFQTLTVDSSSSFNPQTLFAKPDIPLKIKFTQGQGCTYGVMFPDFGIQKDLTQGGAEISLPAMKPGQYQFSCSMRMIFGVLVVK